MKASTVPKFWPLEDNLIPHDVHSDDIKLLMAKVLELSYNIGALTAMDPDRVFTERENFVMAYINTFARAFEVMLAKNAAYARSEPLGNLNLVERLTGGYIPTSLGIVTRAGDKLTRMANHSISMATKQDSAADRVESVQDNDVLDLMNYCVLYSYAIRKEANAT